MIYQNFQAYSDMAGPVRTIADIAANVLAYPLPGLSRNALHRACAALCALVARAGLSHQRPPFGIDTVEIDGRLTAVRETAVHRTPFCTLLHLEKDQVKHNSGAVWWRRCRGSLRHCCAAQRGRLSSITMFTL